MTAGCVMGVMTSKPNKRHSQKPKKTQIHIKNPYAHVDQLIEMSSLNGKCKLVKSIINQNRFFQSLRVFDAPEQAEQPRTPSPALLRIQELHESNVLESWRQLWCKLFLELNTLLHSVAYVPSARAQRQVLLFNKMNKTEKQEFLQKYGNRARAELKKVKTEIKIFKACLKPAELHKPEALGGIKWLLDEKYIEMRINISVISRREVSFLVWLFAYVDKKEKFNECVRRTTGEVLEIASFDEMKETHYLLCNFGWFKQTNQNPLANPRLK